MDRIYLSFNDICLCIIALFFPPLSVLLKAGCNKDFCINLFLSILFWFLGSVHAIYVIFRENETYTRLNEQNDENNNNQNNVNNIPENAIVVILPGANVNTSNTIPSNLPPPSYTESEQIAKEQQNLLYPDLPSYEATSSAEKPQENNEKQ